MEKEFEFTKQQVIELERAISSLNEQKSAIVFEKKGFENDLSTLNAHVRSFGKKLVPEKYKSICKDQDKLKRQILNLEKQIEQFSIEIRKKSLLKDDIKNQLNESENKKLPVQLIQIRDYYINFAADRTRVSSMRGMAAEFAEKIEQIIKQL